MVYFYFAPHAYLTYSLSREHASFKPYLSTNCNLAIFFSQQIHPEIVPITAGTWPTLSGPTYQTPTQYETLTYHIRPQRTISDHDHIGRVLLGFMCLILLCQLL